MRFFLAYWREGYIGALSMGIRHGLFCLGCCWALMAVMYVVGVMNLVWMAVLGILMLTEKVWKYGQQVSKVSGAGFIVWGAIILMYHFS